MTHGQWRTRPLSGRGSGQKTREPGGPRRRPPPGNDDDWIAQFMQDVADATTDERLRELRAGIGKAIVAKHITADKSG